MSERIIEIAKEMAQRDAKYAKVSQLYDALFQKYAVRWTHKPDQHYRYALGGMGPGWHDLIERCIVDCIALGWDRRCAQIKEKFGTLRFYIGAGSNEVHQRIAQAEDESAVTCEECGKPGVARSGGWIRTLCDEHAEGKEAIQNE